MENALKAKPEDVREQHERHLKDLQDVHALAASDLSRIGWVITRQLGMMRVAMHEH
jgi:hypothetical protein